jgi:hypothetical protein
MTLNPTGPAPIVTVKFGNTNVTGQCFISFQAEPLNTPGILIREFNTATATNQLTLNPQDLLDPPSNKVGDLSGCYVGWSVFFYTFVGLDPKFRFSLKIQQSSIDIISPIIVTQDSEGIIVVKDSNESSKLVISFADFKQIV